MTEVQTKHKKFAILRSATDAVNNAISQVKGHEIDPRLGANGGFWLEYVFTDHPNHPWPRDLAEPEATITEVESYDPKIDATRITQRTKRYKCFPDERDAAYYAGLRPGWQYIPCDGEAVEKMIYNMTGPVAPVLDPRAPADTVDTQRPALDRYHAMQRAAAHVREASGQPIDLNASLATLSEYVAKYGQTEEAEA